MSIAQSMTRTQRRAAEAHLRQQNAQWSDTLKPWPREQWRGGHPPPPGLISAYRSRNFMVQVFQAEAPAVVRLSINRTAIKRDGSWVDGITWEDLQRIKSECGYGSCDAIEVYPADIDVVNVANMRHLWILEDGQLPFAWRRKF